MVILGVDYGDARTGVAMCDKNETLAFPLCTIEETSPDKLASKIKGFVSKYEVEKIVLGYPKNMDGSEGFRADKCKVFAELLAEKTNVDVQLVDERLTTVSAHRSLSDCNVRGKKRKGVVDSLSAVIILQSFIDKT